jgi:hypothetical protein
LSKIQLCSTNYLVFLDYYEAMTLVLRISVIVLYQQRHKVLGRILAYHVIYSSFDLWRRT